MSRPNTMTEGYRLCAAINAVLLWRGKVDPQTRVGSITMHVHREPRLAKVVRIMNESGGVRVLFSSTTMPQTVRYLEGFQEALSIMAEPTAEKNGKEAERV